MEIKDREFYDKNQDQIVKLFEDWSYNNYSAAEAAEGADYDDEDVEFADGTAHGDHAENKVGDFESYEENFEDEIEDSIGDKLRLILEKNN